MMTTYTVTLPDGRVVSAGQYARAIKLARDNPYRDFRDGVNWWTETGQEIYDRFRFVTLHDIINQRGKLHVRDLSDTRLARKRAAHLTLTCAWCGRPVTADPDDDLPLNYYYPGARAFCSEGCRGAYYN